MGAWLGIGASPGALVLGAVIAQRHAGPVPLLAVLLGVALIALLLWFQGLLGLSPPAGEGGRLSEVTPRYFGSLMQRVFGGVLALAMVGWFGFNIGLGGAALSALLRLPEWVGPLLLGLPILGLSLRGLRSWNGLATLTTVSALILVVLIAGQFAAKSVPVTLSSAGGPTYLLWDVAGLTGYVAVFSVRAPDFTAGLGRRKDLAILVGLLCGALLSFIFAGIGLQLGTGSTDLVATLAGPSGLVIGNLLVAVSVISASFTTLYSGAPALTAATGLERRRAMVLIALIGFVLAVARFDLYLGSWLAVLAAILPPLLVPMAVEGIRRRRGYAPRLVSLWAWAPGSLLAIGLTFIQPAFASLTGLVTAAVATSIWYYIHRSQREPGVRHQE
jgi:purine-cytosine permease-like protein